MNEIIVSGTPEQIVEAFDFELCGDTLSHFMEGQMPKKPRWSSIFLFAEFEEDNSLNGLDLDKLARRYKSENLFSERFLEALAKKYNFRLEKIYPLKDFLI